MSSLHENVQVADFQKCEPAFAWPSCNLVQVSGMHCHASSTKGRTFVYFVLYCIEYSSSPFYFKPRCPEANIKAVAM